MQELQDELLTKADAATTAELTLQPHLAAYLLELTLLDYDSLAFSASMLAAASVLLARMALAVLRTASDEQHTHAAARREVTLWPAALEAHSDFDAARLQDCVESQWRLWCAAQELAEEEDSSERCVYLKYLHPRWSEVAAIPPLEYVPESAFEAGVTCTFQRDQLGALPVAQTLAEPAGLQSPAFVEVPAATDPSYEGSAEPADAHDS